MSRRRSERASPGARWVPMVLACLLGAALALPRSEAGFSATTSNAASSLAAAASFSTALYLHNNPSPPSGDTATQTSLPMNKTAPTASTLYNYSNNYDAGPGRQLEQTTLGLSETNDRKLQRWAYTTNAALSVSSASVLSIWVASENFTTPKTVGVLAGLYDCNTALSSCSLVQSAANSASPWPNTWTKLTVTLPAVSHTFASGRSIMLKVVPSTNTDINIWLAYDTTAYASVFTLNSGG